jgi:hypothetical protein
LGSSKTYVEEKDSVLDQDDGGAHGLMSSNTTINPTFWEWNKVFIRYCDGASYSGQRFELAGTNNLYFRGRHILDAILTNLVHVQGLGISKTFASPGIAAYASDKTEVMVSGCSAGGLAVYLHLDYIAEYLSATSPMSTFHIVGVPESGMFMDMPSYDGSQIWTPKYAHIAEMQNVTAPGSNLNKDCLKTFSPSNETWRCFMAQYTLPHIHTPFLAVNSVYDGWQDRNILNDTTGCLYGGATAGSCSHGQGNALANLRSAIVGNLSAVVGKPTQLPIPPDALPRAGSCSAFSGYYLFNCGTHCGFLNHDDKFQAFGDPPIGKAVGDWYGFSLMNGTVPPVGPYETVRNIRAAAPGWGPDQYADC